MHVLIVSNHSLTSNPTHWTVEVESDGCELWEYHPQLSHVTTSNDVGHLDPSGLFAYFPKFAQKFLYLDLVNDDLMRFNGNVKWKKT